MRNRVSSHVPARRDGVDGVKAYEIEPGRSVSADWNKALVETWADRKARRAGEQARSGGSC